MNLNELLKQAKTEANEISNKLVESPSRRPRQLRYLVEFDKTTYTAEEIRELLPELEEFAKQSESLPMSRTNLPDNILIELSRHFSSSIEMDEWLETPNEQFEGRRPLDVSYERLLKTLKGVYE